MKRTGTNPLAACSPTRPSGVMPRPTTLHGAAVVTLLAPAPVGCSNRIESVISSTFDQRLPVNASVFVLVTPPLEVSFDRVDTETPQPLEHEAVGSGTSRSDVVYIVDPGDVVVGDAIEVLASCVPDCPERNRATITFDREADLDAPVVQEGEVTARVGGMRNHPFDPFIARYEVDLRFGELVDDSPTFVRFRSDDLEAIRPTGGLSAFVEVDGGIQRRFCFDADFIDAAGNETILARDLCVDLAPATALPWGEIPATEF